MSYQRVIAVQSAADPNENIHSYIEEMIVRRELSINYVARNPNYDRLTGCPEWALKTLAKHANRKGLDLSAFVVLAATAAVSSDWPTFTAAEPSKGANP